MRQQKPDLDFRGNETVYVPFIDPRNIEQKGMYSFPDPMALQPGQWQYAENTRWDRNLAKSRKANRPLGSGVGTKPSGWLDTWQIRGHRKVTPNGNILQLVAYEDDSGNVRVYNVAQDGTHTEITSGVRWADDGSWLWATTFSDLQSGTDFVIFGTQGSVPRVWNGSTLSSAVIANPVANPKDSNLWKSQAGMTSFFTVSSAGTTTFTNSDAANWAGADAGTGSDLYIQFSRSTTASSSPTSLVTFTSAIDGTSARQVMFYVQPGEEIGSWLEYVKIELYDGTNYYTVHDPTSTYARAFEVEGLVEGDAVWVCSVDAPPSGFALNSVDGFRLTFTGSAPATASNLNVLAVAFGGQVPGGSLYVASYFNPSTRCESAGIAIELGTGQRLQSTGGGEWGGRRWPVSPVMYVQTTLGVLNTSSAEIADGVTRIRIYRADSALDQDGNVVLEAQASYVSASVNGTADTVSTITDNLRSSSRITEIVSPSAFCQSPPASTDMLAANGRIFALGKSSSSDTSGRFNTLWVSEFDNQLRFQEVIAYGWQNGQDDRSATRSTLDGDMGKRLVALATADLGILTVFPFGRNAVYTMIGTDSLSLSAPKVANLIGTNQANSVSTYKNELFWLGTDGQVYRGSASIARPISYNRVDDQIPNYVTSNPWAAFGFVAQGFYYLALSASESTSVTKPKALVYEIEDDLWCGWDVPPDGKSIDTGVSFRNDLLYVCSGLDGTVCRHDGGASATDIANVAGVATEDAIQIKFTSPRIAVDDNFSTGLGLKRVEIVSDDVDLTAGAGAIVCTPAYIPGGTSVGSITINMNTAGLTAWRVGTMPLTDNSPNDGYAMEVAFTAQMLSGKELRRLRAGWVSRRREPSSL